MDRLQLKYTKKRVRGFSLIELLVVILIIGVLLGVLLPALGGAKQQAQSTVCASRMRQVAIGWTLYADANDDISLPGQPGRYSDPSLNLYDVGNGLQYRPRWYAMMGAAAGFFAFAEPSREPADEHSLQVMNKIFLCPTADDWTSTRNHPYGYNHQFLGNTRFRNDNEAEGFIKFPVRISGIDSSRTVLAGDSLGTAGGKPRSVRTPNLVDGSRHPELTSLGGHGYILDPPRLTPDSDYADRRNRLPEHRSAPDERHLGKANFSFADGHVVISSAADMGYVKNADGSFAAWGPGTSNSKFSGTSRDVDPPLVR